MTNPEQHILITGGTRGVGRALAVACARSGAKVALTYGSNDLDRDETLALLSEIGVEPLVFKGDVADRAHAKRVYATLMERWPRLDGLACCAGLNQTTPPASPAFTG